MSALHEWCETVDAQGYEAIVLFVRPLPSLRLAVGVVTRLGDTFRWELSLEGGAEAVQTGDEATWSLAKIQLLMAVDAMQIGLAIAVGDGLKRLAARVVLEERTS